MDSGVFPAKVSSFFQAWKSRRSFSILVIGDCGSGKTTLVNNLLRQEIAHDEGSSIISTYQGEFQGVPVTVHETSGMDADSRGDTESENVMRSLLRGGELDVIIYCFKASETRMRDSFIRTLQVCHNIGLDWRKTVFALTYADVLPIPAHDRRDPSYDQARYFDSRVDEWKRKISQALIDRVGVPAIVAAGLKLAPTAGDFEDELPNYKQWFGPMWSVVIDVANVVPFSSTQRNIPDQPRPPVMHSATQPTSYRAGAKSSTSQPSRHQARPRNEGFGSRDGLLSPPSQRGSQSACSIECVCSGFKNVVVGFADCIAACCRIMFHTCRKACH